MERDHANYDRWEFAATAVVRRRIENDMEEESGEEEERGSEQGSSEPVGKTSGLGPEDCAEQEGDGATTYIV